MEIDNYKDFYDKEVEVWIVTLEILNVVDLGKIYDVNS